MFACECVCSHVSSWMIMYMHSVYVYVFVFSCWVYVQPHLGSLWVFSCILYVFMIACLQDEDFTEMAVAMSLDADSDATRPGTAMEALCHECNCYIFWVNYFQNMFTCVCVCFRWFCIFHVRVPRSVVSWHDRVGFGVWAVPYREFKTFPKEGCSQRSEVWNSKEDPFTRTDYCWMLLFLIINY